jgi:hypothetical protein
MRKNIGFTSIRTLTLVLGTVAVGFVLTRTATSVAKAPTAPTNGGIDHAIEQAKRLVAELREANWDVSKVDQKLLRLPEQDFKQSWADRRPSAQSFAIPRTAPEYATSPERTVFDEVALTSSTFVNYVPRNGKSGDSTREGYYIIAWMDGRITTVDAPEARYFAVPGREGDYFTVYPGMDEYDKALTALPGTRGDKAAKKSSGVGS